MVSFVRRAQWTLLGLLALNVMVAASGTLFAISSAGALHFALPRLARTAPTAPQGGLSDLVEALGRAGATVELGPAVRQSFFSAPGRVVRVNGAEVQVFEYADEAARRAESATISSDGSTIGRATVLWRDPANFWAEGRMIVLYVGHDAAVIAQLTQLLDDRLTLPAPGAFLDKQKESG